MAVQERLASNMARIPKFDVMSDSTNQVSYLSADRVNCAVDEVELKELKRYKECKANLESAKQKLAEAKPGTKEYNSYMLACKTFELLLDMMNPPATRKARTNTLDR
jgi:hypothetical protein